MDELIEILKETGLPYVYSHYAQGEVPEPPYICYAISSSHPFGADGKVYASFMDVDLELYTNAPDWQTVKTILSVLDAHGIFYGVTETWIPEEGLYQTWITFEMEV